VIEKNYMKEEDFFSKNCCEDKGYFVLDCYLVYSILQLYWNRHLSCRVFGELSTPVMNNLCKMSFGFQFDYEHRKLEVNKYIIIRHQLAIKKQKYKKVTKR